MSAGYFAAGEAAIRKKRALGLLLIDQYPSSDLSPCQRSGFLLNRMRDSWPLPEQTD
jgi:hypothetical protein